MPTLILTALKTTLFRALTRDIVPQLIIFQQNVKGLSRDKSSYLARLLSKFKTDVVLLQETHVPDGHSMVINSYLSPITNNMEPLPIYEMISPTRATYIQE